MSAHELRDLLDDVPDTREIVLRRAPTWSAVYDAWRDAAEDAGRAYGAWLRVRDGDAWTAYVAAQDRADAAQDAFALSPAGASGPAPAGRS
jgi:hypothetical protein